MLDNIFDTRCYLLTYHHPEIDVYRDVKEKFVTWHWTALPMTWFVAFGAALTRVMLSFSLHVHKFFKK